VIQTLGWDSQILGVRTGQLMLEDKQNLLEDMGSYDLVIAKVPQVQGEIVNLLENHGFRYIGLDMTLERTSFPKNNLKIADKWKIHLIEKKYPDFDINGFEIKDSRFMLDVSCKQRLPKNFWDKVVKEHCENFADVVICVTNTQNRLLGFSSCLKKPNYLEMFLVAVHPLFQGLGIGNILIQETMRLAKNLALPVTTTSVMVSNIFGLNFYFKNEFMYKTGTVILHHWKEVSE
jgi:dTDP-4-amino-4,6-dideoxy-D-galactose acyltransferase